MPLSDTQRLLRKAKESERDLGRWLLKHDGEDPQWRGVASSTGRVGHVTGLQFDVISKSYAGENKRVRLGKRFLQWWLQIVDISVDRHKDALLSIEPTNELAVKRHIPRMHIITEERHAELLKMERLAGIYGDILDSMPTGIEDMIEDKDDLEWYNSV